jgi:hypothetical protein
MSFMSIAKPFMVKTQAKSAFQNRLAGSWHRHCKTAVPLPQNAEICPVGARNLRGSSQVLKRTLSHSLRLMAGLADFP